MDERYTTNQEAMETPGSDSSVRPQSHKKPYRKPEFLHERVFETMALSCGKISPTQGQCHFSRKSS